MTFSPPPGGIYIDPLVLSNNDLYDTMLSLGLLCGKAKSPLRERHRKIVCNALTLFNVVATNRGVTPPPKPYRTGSYDHGPIA